MLAALAAGLVYGLSGGLLPGPLLTLVIRQTLRHGAAEGVKTSFVPLLTDGPLIIVLLLFMERLTRIRPLLGAIAFAGALYLLYLAWESWTSRPPESVELVAGEAPRSILRGVFVNYLNPNPYLFWITVGMPTLARSWNVGWGAASTFLVVFFTCLIGSKVLLALALARSRAHIIRFYVPAMRMLGLLLLVFAALAVRDGIGLFRN
ncbi:MAG TPA: LysE family transporter [Thermoanaerobaculia bacterium]